MTPHRLWFAGGFIAAMTAWVAWRILYNSWRRATHQRRGWWAEWRHDLDHLRHELADVVRWVADRITPGPDLVERRSVIDALGPVPDPRHPAGRHYQRQNASRG